MKVNKIKETYFFKAIQKQISFLRIATRYFTGSIYILPHSVTKIMK